MSAAWNHFWFAPGDPVQLGIIRTLFYVFLLFVATKSTIGAWARLYHRLPAFWRPVTFFQLMPPPPQTPSFVRLMDVGAIVWKLSIVWAATGLAFPFGGIAATLTTLWMLGYENQFGKTNHARTLLPIVSLILTCAPPDALCYRPVFSFTDPAYGYFWPIQIARVQVAIVWFFAGISKLRHSGLRWAVSNNLSSLLKLHVMDYYFVSPKAPPLARFLAGQDWLCRLLAVGTLVLELGFPLGLFFPVLGMVLAGLCMGLLIGFALAQGPLFLPLFSMLFLLWFPFPS